MKAKTARKISDRYRDPMTLRGMLEQIKELSKLGFCNFSFYVEDGKAELMAKRFQILGYKTYITENFDRGQTLLDVEW